MDAAPAFKKVLLLAVLAVTSAGCSIHYYDPQTGTEHLWGFGHLKMKVLPEGQGPVNTTNQAVAILTSVQTLGFGLGVGQDYGGLAAGWDSRARLTISPTGGSFCFLWPSNSPGMSWNGHHLFNLRITTNLPSSFKP